MPLLARRQVELLVEVTKAFHPADRRCLRIDPQDQLICYIQRSAPPGWCHAKEATARRAKIGLVPIAYTRCVRLVPPSAPRERLFVSKHVDLGQSSPQQPVMKTKVEAPLGWFPRGSSFRSRTWAFLENPSSSKARRATLVHGARPFPAPARACPPCGGDRGGPNPRPDAGRLRVVSLRDGAD